MIKRQKGFTLLELLIVVIIIGILASMAIPQYQKVIRKSKAAEALTNLAALRASMDRYWYEQVAMGVGAYNVIVLNMGGVQGDAGVNIQLLDVENPNAVPIPPRKWEYGIDDDGDNNARAYVIEANDPNDNEDPVVTWIQMNQDGEIRKSENLGGGGALFNDLHV